MKSSNSDHCPIYVAYISLHCLALRYALVVVLPEMMTAWKLDVRNIKQLIYFYQNSAVALCVVV